LQVQPCGRAPLAVDSTGFMQNAEIDQVACQPAHGSFAQTQGNRHFRPAERAGFADDAQKLAMGGGEHGLAVVKEWLDTKFSK
jgi:hypothetical protein